MRNFILFCLMLFISAVAFAQEKKAVAVTVYNNDLGVIKEIRNLQIPNGSSQIAITDVAQLIDPTSVHIKLNGEVIEQNYQYDLVSVSKILGKYINKQIELISKEQEVIRGELLSAQSGQIVLRKNDGGLLMLPNLSDYRISAADLPEGLITKPTLLWKVNSSTSKNQDVEISYQTGGMNWHAEYVAVLNEKDTEMSLKSWVSIANNSGTSYKNAALKLVAGDVNLVKDQNVYLEDRVYAVAESRIAKQEQFQEQSFFEYHIYNLQRQTDLSNNETKQISLFEADNVSVQKKYLYRSGFPYYYGRFGNNNSQKVSVAIEFENKESKNLGMPMPKGKVRLYKSDGKAVEFIGEDLIDHTPKDEKVKLKIGEAFDILAEEKQTDQKRITDKVQEQAFEIKIKNRKDEDVTVEVEKYLGTNWEIIDSNLEYEKVDAFKVLFKIPVEKNDETTVKLRVRYTY